MGKSLILNLFPSTWLPFGRGRFGRMGIYRAKLIKKCNDESYLTNYITRPQVLLPFYKSASLLHKDINPLQKRIEHCQTNQIFVQLRTYNYIRSYNRTLSYFFCYTFRFNQNSVEISWFQSLSWSFILKDFLKSKLSSEKSYFNFIHLVSNSFKFLIRFHFVCKEKNIVYCKLFDLESSM